VVDVTSLASPGPLELLEPLKWVNVSDVIHFIALFENKRNIKNDCYGTMQSIHSFTVPVCMPFEVIFRDPSLIPPLCPREDCSRCVADGNCFFQIRTG